MAQIRTGMSTAAPVSLAADRFGNVYGVNGVTRGFRYSGGTSSQTMGITVAASINASPVTPPLYYVSDIVVNDPGENYIAPPTVSVQGVSSVRPKVSGGGVAEVVFPWSATTHAAAPQVSLSGGQATGGSISVQNLGGAIGVEVTPGGAMYTTPPSVSFFANTGGVTGSVTEVRAAQGRAVLDAADFGRVTAVILTDGGQYVVGPNFKAGVAPVAATVTGASWHLSTGPLPSMTVRFSGIASGAAVSSAGTEYTSAPNIIVSSMGPRRAGGGAIVECEVESGKLTGATVTQPGTGYDGAIAVTLASPPAKASATVRPRLAGRYLCAVRYADSTPESRGGPNYGNVSDLTEVDCGDGAQAILWTGLTTSNPDPSRITHLELWRTTGDQAITLYRVARYAIGSVPPSFMDEMPDDQLATGASVRAVSVVTGLTITARGSGYSTAPTVTIAGGGGSGATATVTMTRTVGSVTMISKGSGYTSAPSVSISGASGSGTVATAVMEHYIASLSLTSGGSGYTTAPLVLIGGLAGYASATISGGSVVSVSLSVTTYPFAINPASPPAITFSGGGGSGAAASAVLLQRVASVAIADGGVGYTGTPSVTFSGGGGTGASAVATLASGLAVGAYALTSRGSGYTSAPTVTLSGGEGSGAALTATIDTIFVPTSSEVYSLPILTDEGYPSAERFGVPPSDMAVMCFYQDRAWYAVSDTRPNTLCFSEVDEPESVPPAYEVNLQQSGSGGDRITGLFVMDGSLYVAQGRGMYRLLVAGNPLESASSTAVAQRGAFSQRCIDICDGIAYLADSFGVYAFDGARVEPLSDAVANFWSDPIIDFSGSRWFSVLVDPQDRVVRFYHKQVGDSATYPTRSLCYSLVTKAWWTESYAHQVGAPFIAVSGGRERQMSGSAVGGSASITLPGGLTDAGSAVAYDIKTGNFPLNAEPRRGVRLTYTPTTGSHPLGVACFYNGATEARKNAIATDVGTGVVSVQGGTQAAVELNVSRSSLGLSNGVAQVVMVGRLDDKSAGGDRDMAVELSGVQQATKAIIHRMIIEGAG